MTTDATKQTAPVTLVTAYFHLEDPLRNRTARDYHEWMAALLPFIGWPMIVFCDAESVAAIHRLRAGKPTVCHATRWDELSVWRHRDILRAHNAQRHPGFNADLSLIYHEKVNFVRRAIDENPYQSGMFLWCDIGLMRGIPGKGWMRRVLRLSNRIEWPSLQVCRARFGDQVVFFGTPNRTPPPPHPRAGIPVLGFRRDLGRQGAADAALL